MRYLIWSWEHDAWWRPARRGYTEDVAEAGRYTEAEAAEETVGHIPPGEEVAVDEVWALGRGRPPVYGVKPATSGGGERLAAHLIDLGCAMNRVAAEARGLDYLPAEDDKS